MKPCVNPDRSGWRNVARWRRIASDISMQSRPRDSETTPLL
jgi:hypothetical protein